MPGHLTREKTSHLTSSKTPRLAGAPGSFLCYTLERRIEQENVQTARSGKDEDQWVPECTAVDRVVAERAGTDRDAGPARLGRRLAPVQSQDSPVGDCAGGHLCYTVSSR